MHLKCTALLHKCSLYVPSHFSPGCELNPLAPSDPLIINTAFLNLISIIRSLNEHDISLVIVRHDSGWVTAVVTDVVSRINELAATLSKPQWVRKKKNQFRVNHNAIKPSLGLSFTEIMRSEPKDDQLLIDVFTGRDAKSCCETHSRLCLCFFFPLPTQKIIISVKQARQHFFLLLKRTHVIIMFYLLSLKSVPQRRPGSLHQTSKSRMVLIKVSAPLGAESLDTFALIFSFCKGKSLKLHPPPPQKKVGMGHGASEGELLLNLTSSFIKQRHKASPNTIATTSGMAHPPVPTIPLNKA